MSAPLRFRAKHTGLIFENPCYQNVILPHLNARLGFSNMGGPRQNMYRHSKSTLKLIVFFFSQFSKMFRHCLLVWQKYVGS